MSRRGMYNEIETVEEACRWFARGYRVASFGGDLGEGLTRGGGCSGVFAPGVLERLRRERFIYGAGTLTAKGHATVAGPVACRAYLATRAAEKAKEDCSPQGGGIDPMQETTEAPKLRAGQLWQTPGGAQFITVYIGPDPVAVPLDTDRWLLIPAPHLEGTGNGAHVFRISDDGDDEGSAAAYSGPIFTADELLTAFDLMGWTCLGTYARPPEMAGVTKTAELLTIALASGRGELLRGIDPATMKIDDVDTLLRITAQLITASAAAHARAERLRPDQGDAAGTPVSEILDDHQGGV